MRKRDPKEQMAQSKVRTIDGMITRPARESTPVSRFPVFLKGNILLPVFVVFVVLVGAVWYFWLSPESKISQNRYQAVFLSNGQVYFGKLSGLNGRYATL